MSRGAYSDEIIRDYQNEANEDAADWCEACAAPYLELKRVDGMEFCPHCRPKALEATRNCPACQRIAPGVGHDCAIYNESDDSIALDELRKEREERRKQRRR